jgi:photosystem II stability/assembly factor-like uncharacterized protein
MRRRGDRPALVPEGKAGARLREFRIERGLSDEQSDPPWSPYAEAIKEKERQRAALDPKIPQPAWSPIGPFSIPHGQTYGSARPSVSGRISCIAIDPQTPAHILVGSAAGGIWETKDDGGSWRAAESIKAEFPISIGAIAFVPGQSKLVYAGTGEGNWLSDYGVGLWKSEDGGATWSELVTSPFVGLGFYAIVMDPLDPKNILAATTGGLFQSTTGGTNWNCVLRARCWDVSIHPKANGNQKSTKEVFAATQDGLFLSTDGGSSWPTKIDLVDAPDSFERLAVCHARSNGDVVYAFSKDKFGQPALWRRPVSDGRFDWMVCPRGINTTQIDYDWFVSTSPTSADVVYLGAVSLWKGASRQDGTWNWSNISSRKYGDSIHPDQHAIAFGVGDSVYAGNDGGIFKSADGGTSWQSLNQGLCITHFEYIAQHPDYDAWLLGGTQDNGTLRYEGGEVWYEVAEGDGGECATNEASPYTVYHCFQEMSLQRSLTGGGAGSWKDVGPSVPDNYRKLFYPPMEVHRNLVVQAGQTVFVSTDTGTTFQELYLPEDAGIATALWLAGPFQFLVGSDSGDVFRFDWIGDGWVEPTTLAQPRAGIISSIRGDPSNSWRLWTTYSDIMGPSVYRSDDGGYSWTSCMNGLPHVAANILEVNPSEMDTVYVGTDAGIWRSDNAGAKCQWALFSNGLPNAIVGDLAFHAKTGILRAATRSRGVWELDVSKEVARDVQVYLRHSTIDTGRQYPSLQWVADPFSPGGFANWWESTDILIDSTPYSIAHIDFVVFEENRRADPKNAHGLTQVFVQVHQRGRVSAKNVVVRLYAAPAVGSRMPDSIPDLPQGFWVNPDQPAEGSKWKLVGPRVSLIGLQTGQPKIAAFRWTVPEAVQGDAWLLATATADNDKLETTELNVRTLVQTEAKCAIKGVVCSQAAIA